MALAAARVGEFCSGPAGDGASSVVLMALVAVLGGKSCSDRAGDGAWSVVSRVEDGASKVVLPAPLCIVMANHLLNQLTKRVGGRDVGLLDARRVPGRNLKTDVGSFL